MAFKIEILFQALRVPQWLKNLAIFGAILFTGQLFNPQLFILSFKAFLIFCLISSGSYLINDVLDAPRDRLHPFKKFRPVASGQIKEKTALVIALSLIFLGLFWATKITPAFFLTALIFVFLHIIYSLKLKHVAVADIFIIALGYLIRIYAGEFATGYHITFWLALCAISLSLFLAVGKRRAELTLIESAKDLGKKTRPSLEKYNEKLLDTYTAMFASSTWITYAYYTFLEKPPALSRAFGRIFDFMFPGAEYRKWLMVTIPVVIYGIMRYMQLIYEKQEGEQPEKILITDKPLLTTVLVRPDGATIKVDGDFKGTAPLVISNISEGDHQIEVFASGYKSRKVKVKTVKSYRLTVNMDLAKIKREKEEKEIKGTPTPLVPPKKEITPLPIKEEEATESAKKFEKGTKIVVKETETGWLRVRLEPSLSGSEAAKVNPGDEFIVLDEKNGWVKIEYEKGKEGWVSGDYVSPK